MTRLELIQLIGDALTQLDVLRGSLLPGEPNRTLLDQLRDELDTQQLKLAQNEFDDNTAAFVDATAKLVAINKDMNQTLKSIDKLVTTIDNLKRFVGAVNDIVGIALPFL
jgi:ABC-type transporter Mla subunit MlaD